tara:strand:- start:1403 stop:1618 length:216 start_codon:yes stop_codon:yes gene_type:complete
MLTAGSTWAWWLIEELLKPLQRAATIAEVFAASGLISRERLSATAAGISDRSPRMNPLATDSALRAQFWNI